jgi:hypothetical protein
MGEACSTMGEKGNAYRVKTSMHNEVYLLQNIDNHLPDTKDHNLKNHNMNSRSPWSPKP